MKFALLFLLFLISACTLNHSDRKFEQNDFVEEVQTVGEPEDKEQLLLSEQRASHCISIEEVGSPDGYCEAESYFDQAECPLGFGRCIPDGCRSQEEAKERGDKVCSPGYSLAQGSCPDDFVRCMHSECVSFKSLDFPDSHCGGAAKLGPADCGQGYVRCIPNICVEVAKVSNPATHCGNRQSLERADCGDKFARCIHEDCVPADEINELQCGEDRVLTDQNCTIDYRRCVNRQ
jgi:hypothetical protein